MVEQDTTDPALIEANPCSRYSWFQRNSGKWESQEYIGGLGDGTASSLHEITCKWAAYQKGLSLDSTHLARYVRVLGDSLCLKDGLMAYAVQMTEIGTTTPSSSLYIVAQVGDSLFYREIDTNHYDPDYKKSWTIRALRPLAVSGGDSQYIWFEYNLIARGDKNGQTYVSENWKGEVYAYDYKDGIQFLEWAPIRYEERIGGHPHGVRQLDVRFPEAGIMHIEERFQKGAHVTRGMGWNHHLGRQVIDREAVE